MKQKNKIIDGILRLKNKQINAEKEHSRALEQINSILSAYIAALIDAVGVIRVSRDKIKSAIGKYSACVSLEGSDYVITLKRNGDESEAKADDEICSVDASEKNLNESHGVTEAWDRCDV